MTKDVPVSTEGLTHLFPEYDPETPLFHAAMSDADAWREEQKRRHMGAYQEMIQARGAPEFRQQAIYLLERHANGLPTSPID